MVNIMCLLGYAMGPKYLIKPQSRCYNESIFQIRLTFKLVDFHKDQPPNCGWASSNQMKDLWRNVCCPLRRNSAPMLSSDSSYNLNSFLQVQPAAVSCIRLASPHNCMIQLLKISMYTHTCTHAHTQHTHACTLLILFSLKNPDSHTNISGEEISDLVVFPNQRQDLVFHQELHNCEFPKWN